MLVVAFFDFALIALSSLSGAELIIQTLNFERLTTVPAGKFDALLFNWHYKGKVGPASIDDAIYRFFAPGVGPVAFIEFKHISAMLIYSYTEKWGAVLTDHK